MNKYLTPLGYKIPKKSYEAMAEISQFSHEEILQLYDILQTDKPYRELCIAALKYSLCETRKFKVTLEKDKK